MATVSRREKNQVQKYGGSNIYTYSVILYSIVLLDLFKLDSFLYTYTSQINSLFKTLFKNLPMKQKKSTDLF